MEQPAVGTVRAPVAHDILAPAPFTMKSVAGAHFLDPT
jgi:hypothetical protein